MDLFRLTGWIWRLPGHAGRGRGEHEGKRRGHRSTACIDVSTFGPSMLSLRRSSSADKCLLPP